LDLGTLFKFEPGTGTFTSVLEFTGTNGAAKGTACVAALIDDGAGLLWGTTDRGGANDLGTVFKFNPANGVLTTVVSFAGPDGRNPKSRLLSDGLGFFHGTAAGGGV